MDDEITSESNGCRRVDSDGYRILQNIGEGSYAKVKLAYSLQLNQRVALKIMNLKKMQEQFKKKFLPRELCIHSLIKHKNIIKIHEYFALNHKIYVAMEFAERGDLLTYIKSRNGLSEAWARFLFEQIASAIEYIHDRNWVHRNLGSASSKSVTRDHNFNHDCSLFKRDLKCENVLLCEDYTVKVSDFGFARPMLEAELSTTYCGSAAYAPPEVLAGIPYEGKPYDIWSIGVILYVMIMASLPYKEGNARSMIRQQKYEPLRFDGHSHTLSIEYKSLVRAILNPEPSARLNIEEILHDDWLLKSRSVKNRVNLSRTMKACCHNHALRDLLNS